ncbi:MAG: RagB/SusD family nutrient uptake outer membrane protein [Gemmatimonadaceae bacterium]
MKVAKKNRLLVGTAILTLLSAGLYGCNDFLETNAVPQGTLDEGTLSTAAGVEGTLVAAYRALDCPAAGGSWGCAASNWVWGSVAGDDSYKGSDSGDQPPINDIEGYHWSAPNGQDYINEKWTISYEGVSRANATLRLLKKVVAAKPDEIPAADAKSIEGEALFLRAHYHFEAYRMWGNIPYYREDETDFRKANNADPVAGATAVVADIIKDLDDAIALLPTTPRNKGRAGQWTAKAYKGRVQVYSGQYAGAVVTLTDVVNNGPYALETSFDHVWTGFKEFYNGKETIWAFQASVNDGQSDGNNGNFGERLNFPYSGSHFGCCGFNQPSQNLVNFYRVDAAGLPLAVTASPNNDPTDPGGTWNANDAAFEAGNAAAVDPRLDWTVGRNKVPYKDWGLVKVTTGSDTWVRDIGNGGPYTPKKNAHEKASGAEQIAGGWAPTQQNSVRIHLFRYADLLLMLAEAQVETGNFAAALPLVNQIRTRAGVTAQGCGAGADSLTVATYPQCAGDNRIAVPINDPKITWATYRVGQYPSFPTQQYAREAVRAERRLELAMEGQRLYDIRRWGFAYAGKAINNYINGEGGGAEKTRRLYKTTADPFVQRHLRFPIPNAQINLSKVGTESRLTQNPGW